MELLSSCRFKACVILLSALLPVLEAYQGDFLASDELRFQPPNHLQYPGSQRDEITFKGFDEEDASDEDTENDAASSEEEVDDDKNDDSGDSSETEFPSDLQIFFVDKEDQVKDEETKKEETKNVDKQKEKSPSKPPAPSLMSAVFGKVKSMVPRFPRPRLTLSFVKPGADEKKKDEREKPEGDLRKSVRSPQQENQQGEVKYGNRGREVYKQERLNKVYLGAGKLVRDKNGFAIRFRSSKPKPKKTQKKTQKKSARKTSRSQQQRRTRVEQVQRGRRHPKFPPVQSYNYYY